RRGTAELAPKAPEVLSRIAEFIMPLDNEILVEGFTCDLPIATAQYPSNWELSGGRASRVVRFLEARGVPGRRLSAVGHGEMRPRFRNDTETHRRKNRRVDIVILDTAIPVGKIWSAPSPGHEAQPGEKHVRPMLPKVWRHGEEEGY
ncbi:MAG TPA: OmpA family protein, partial [Armatimonadota bacterium]|nr:OmpA family protein [Armatimonadota bacterium]